MLANQGGTERVRGYCALCVSRCGSIAVVEHGRFVALMPFRERRIDGRWVVEAATQGRFFLGAPLYCPSVAVDMAAEQQVLPDAHQRKQAALLRDVHDAEREQVPR